MYNKKLVTNDREKTKSPKSPSKTKEKPISKTQERPVSKTQERPVSKTQARPISKTQARPISKTQALKKTEKDERNKNIRQCSISTFDFVLRCNLLGEDAKMFFF